jgi:hypothetical protein
MEITIRDVYDRVTEIGAQVGKFGAHLESVEARLESGQARMADHETRLRTMETAIPSSLEMRIMALEKFRWQIAGALVTINGLAVLAEWLMWSKK